MLILKKQPRIFKAGKVEFKKTRILVRKAEFIKYTRIIKVRKAKLKKIAPRKSIFCGAI